MHTVTTKQIDKRLVVVYSKMITSISILISINLTV